MTLIKKQKGRTSNHIQPGKQNTTSNEDRCPKFSLRLLQKSYCLSRCKPQEKAAFADTLHRLSMRTWGELRQLSRHGKGYEKIACHSIQTDIPEVAKNKNLLAFRFNGKAPIVGFRSNATFYVLWVDRAFKLYHH